MVNTYIRYTTWYKIDHDFWYKIDHHFKYTTLFLIFCEAKTCTTSSRSTILPPASANSRQWVRIWVMARLWDCAFLKILSHTLHRKNSNSVRCLKIENDYNSMLKFNTLTWYGKVWKILHQWRLLDKTKFFLNFFSWA